MTTPRDSKDQMMCGLWITEELLYSFYGHSLLIIINTGSIKCILNLLSGAPRKREREVVSGRVSWGLECQAAIKKRDVTTFVMEICGGGGKIFDTKPTTTSSSPS